MKYLVIFPSDIQLERLKMLDREVDIVVKNLIKNNEGKLKYINAETVLDFDINEEVTVLCCNEEAIYWLYSRVAPNMKLFFTHDTFNMCFKLEAYNTLKTAEIGYIVEKSKEFNGTFPVILKPNFGFASTGVKKINNKEMLDEYKYSFESLIENSPVKLYQNKYFSNLKNEIVYEKYIEEGIFFSVPFIYDVKCDDVVLFPLKGIRTCRNDITDFQWAGFEYNPQNIDKDILYQMKEALLSISRKFLLKSSVNMSEMIYDNQERKIKIIEFSPRIPGGKLSEILRLCENINLEELSVELLFDDINFGENLCKYSSEMLLLIDDSKLNENEHYILKKQECKAIGNDKKVTYYFYERNN